MNTATQPVLFAPQLPSTALPLLTPVLNTAVKVGGIYRVGSGTEVFTTGQIARLCRVAPRTVTKWIDTGLLKGYRLAGSLDRRVLRIDLEIFLEQRGLPRDRLNEADGPTVLVVSNFGIPMQAALLAYAKGRYRLTFTPHLGCAGVLFAEMRPRLLVLDAQLGKGDLFAFAAWLTASGRLGACHLLGLRGDEEGSAEAWLAAGFSGAAARSSSPTEIADLISGALVVKGGK